MESSRFSIFGAVRNAYGFGRREWPYLLKIGMPALLLHLIAFAAQQYYDPKASLISIYLWTFPAEIVWAWFMVAEARFLLLGERVESLPADPAFRAQRARSMQTGMLVLLLFDMGITAATAWMSWADESKLLGTDVVSSSFFLFLTGGLVWGVRFSIAHILAAVGYPVKSYLRRVHGMVFSFRLIGLLFCCAVPVHLARLAAILIVLVPAQEMTPGYSAAVAGVNVVFFVLIAPALLNAAGAFALRDMLGRESREGMKA